MSRRDSLRIRTDLEDRGVRPELSKALSSRLEGFADRLPAETYQAVLAGVAIACGEQQKRDGGPSMGRNLEEIQQLLGAFADELRKLDEALEVLSAYALRIRTRSEAGPRILH